MRKQDIKQGQDYAYASSDWNHDSFYSKRVTVIGEPGGIPGRSGDWRTPASPARTEVMLVDDGRIFEVTSREIREPWAQYEARKAVHAKRIEERSAKMVQDMRARVVAARKVAYALREVGVQDSQFVISRSAVLEAVRAEWPSSLTADSSPGVTNYRPSWALWAPLAYELVEYIRTGHGIRIQPEDLLKLAAGS